MLNSSVPSASPLQVTPPAYLQCHVGCLFGGKILLLCRVQRLQCDFALHEPHWIVLAWAP